MKNIILISITVAMAWQFCIGISTLDSDILLIPLTKICFSGAWLFCFFKKNNWFLKAGAR